MKKLILTFSLLTFSLSAYCFGDLHCEAWGDTDTFTLEAELEESGSSYLDAYVDLTVMEQGKIIFQKKRMDSTGLYSLSTLNNQQVYLAELRPIQTSNYQFLSIAANHPYPSGNSYLLFNNKEYRAECFLD